MRRTQQLSAGKGHGTGCFRKPLQGHPHVHNHNGDRLLLLSHNTPQHLVPANSNANLRVRRRPHFEPGVTWREIKLLLVPRAVRDVRFAVDPQHAAVCIDDLWTRPERKRLLRACPARSSKQAHTAMLLKCATPARSKKLMGRTCAQHKRTDVPRSCTCHDPITTHAPPAALLPAQKSEQ